MQLTSLCAVVRHCLAATPLPSRALSQRFGLAPIASAHFGELLLDVCLRTLFFEAFYACP
eukprot:1458871-Pleurochrysis_carterae.AAC.2